VITSIADHLQDKAIIYVIASYLLFAIPNFIYFHIDIENPYGWAMVFIGLFWLGVTELFKRLK